MKLSPNYNEIFENRLVIITGVARSGTSVLEKIIGSFSDTYYSFEPVSFALIPPLLKKGYFPQKQGVELLKATLFEDIFLQMLHGRNVNFNKKDDSYIGNYIDPKIVRENWSKFRRRDDVMKHLKEREYLFVVKNPNLQQVMELITEIFPGVRFIHIIRDGNDVISSSIRRDFYSQDYLNNRNVDCWNDGEIEGVKIPWYVQEKERFSHWNQHTRCAHIWRILNEKGIKFAENNKDRVMQVRLEDITPEPEKFVEKAEKFLGKKRTKITEKNLKSMENYEQRDYPNNTQNIQQPEKAEYMEFRKKLGYPVRREK